MQFAFGLKAVNYIVIVGFADYANFHMHLAKTIIFLQEIGTSQVKLSRHGIYCKL